MSDPSQSDERQAQFRDLIELMERALALLCDPTPDRIEEAGSLIEVAAASVGDHEHWSSSLSTLDLSVLISRCHALQQILETAGKVHWHQIRKLAASLGTYTPSGRLFNARPAASSFSIDC